MKPGFVGKVKTEAEKRGYYVGKKERDADIFKTADKVTKNDELEWEVGRLSNLLHSWIEVIQFKGTTYYIDIDPLNRKVKMNDKPASS